MTAAPVWPALKSAAACPSRTASAATRIDASGLRRSAADADSAISMRSGAWRMRTSTASAPGMPRQRVLDDVARADEQQADLQTSGSDQRPADDGVWRMVATHRVDGDSEHESFQLPASGCQLAAFRRLDEIGKLAKLKLGADEAYASSTGLTWRPW